MTVILEVMMEKKIMMVMVMVVMIKVVMVVAMMTMMMIIMVVVVQTEMEFWGIEEDEIEECCWTNYSAWTTTLDALRKLEKDRKVRH